MAQKYRRKDAWRHICGRDTSKTVKDYREELRKWKGEFRVGTWAWSSVAVIYKNSSERGSSDNSEENVRKSGSTQNWR